jgi:tetratricopeptide (TPR) repeat protein
MNLAASTDPQGHDREVAWRDRASQFSPSSARLRVEAAEAHLRRFQEEMGRLENGQRAVAVTQLVATAVPPASVWDACFPLTPAGQGMAGASWNVASREAQLTATRRHMMPALRDSLEARAACPLMAKPHILLAANVPYLTRSEPALAHLDRAKQLVTNDPQMWFLFGVQELFAGQTDQACASWRRSLELSDQYLNLILDLGKDSLGVNRLAEQVLPEQLEMLFQAAAHLYPQPEAVAERRPFLARALPLLKARPGVPKAGDYYMYAKIHEAVDQPAEAVTAYRKALKLEPRQLGWHLELAQLLKNQGQLDESRRELQMILRLEPANVAARELLDAILRDQARKS